MRGANRGRVERSSALGGETRAVVATPQSEPSNRRSPQRPYQFRLVSRVVDLLLYAARVPGDVREDVDVEDARSYHGESDALEREYWNHQADDEEVTQEPGEHADVAAVEDPMLVCDRGSRILQTEPNGVPSPRFETRDEEVIEVDQDADHGAVGDQCDG
ncbi:hypothetical protein SAMN05443661_11963 [Natronobacterium gregoryi]|uniref:Uncharacterized protein n=2 Tax=Natronobacterium gregoryi TaxID=44930 RepID=L9YF06_NATGS|nr:hypothetical protein C490_02678 [Natronobacterium gregoryi SP2]SFJ26646.1 hypothetical protein SAMN05443661_11963 [Natronobacterium gregoryi]